jgi:hypothetical protein
MSAKYNKDEEALDYELQQIIISKAIENDRPLWIQRMVDGMQLIRQACAENTKWADCADCPFDELCTSINDDYWDHDWHDMTDTMRIVLKEQGYDV